MAKKKRRVDQPVVRPGRKRGPRTAAEEARYAVWKARVGAILARTKAGRKELDARAAGADMRDLKGVPVIVFADGKRPRSGTPKRIGVGGRVRDEGDERFDPDVDVPPPRTPIAPPVAFDAELERFTSGVKKPGGSRLPIHCSACGQLGHRANSKDCPDYDGPVIPPAVAEANAIGRARMCKGCGRPRCRIDSRFCPMNPRYQGDDRDRFEIVIDADVADKLEMFARVAECSLDDAVIAMALGTTIRTATTEESVAATA